MFEKDIGVGLAPVLRSLPGGTILSSGERKPLSKSMSLVGQTETITAMDFRKTPGDILMQAQMGKTFNITKNGVIVAVLTAPELDALELGAEIRRLRLTK